MSRLLQLLIVLLSAPFWVPLLAMAALLVFIFDGRPLFFRQERSGLGGKPFSIYKFRTMRQGPGDDASRITALGRVLRTLSVDEIPQLLNVVKGDMALVGPRPLPTAYLERFNAAERRRLEVRPGITGLAQINGRNSLTWEERFRFDLEYVENRSAALDFRILAKTLGCIVSRRGISHEGEATMSEFRKEV
jgi:lipopolysaccharide/colanic/teichoic acid biosynthesis glycosyltransferase